MATTKLDLTPGEEKLRAVLLDVARAIDDSKELKEKLELRFAGGWVRDKILGIPSHDIDTAINAMTGCSFSEKMKEWAKEDHNLSKHNLSESDFGTIHKIAAQPEKSKHLETATAKILSYDVDFVNLRKEVYVGDSRNPQMEFGTAVEDALRRDATVNALFYNLHSGEVEDFTGGLVDMKMKLIKTPLEPYQTFMDDPLRVLRLIRFASRLQFVIDQEAEKSMADPAIRQALKMKISRERVLIEVEKNAKRNSALCLIDRLGLYSTIFTDPTTKVPEPSTERWHLAYECLRDLMANESPGSVRHLLVHTNEAEGLAWWLAALSPWAEIPIPAGFPGGKNPIPYAALVAREGIKLPSLARNVVTGAFRNFEGILTMKRDVLSGKAYSKQRDVLGMQIRKWNADGGFWRLHVLLAILVEAMRSDVSGGYHGIFARWQEFLDHLKDMDVLEAPSQKAPLTGTQLSNALGVKTGIWMKGALEVCMAWQFRHPGEVNTAGAIEEVKARAEELGIPVKI